MSGNPMWRCLKCGEWVSAPTGSMLDEAIARHKRQHQNPRCAMTGIDIPYCGCCS